jgi:hypothetical protein
MNGLSVWGGLEGGSSSQSITARTLITDVYRDLGVLRPGQTPGSDALADGLRRLNRMIDSWAAERLMVPNLERIVYDLTPGVHEYVIGDDGERPVRVEQAGYLTSGATEDSPIDVLPADPRNSGDSGVFCDNAWPVANLYLTSEPAAGDQLVLYVRRKLQSFDDLDISYSLPPAYEQAIFDNLAVMLAPSAAIITKIPNPLLNDLRARAATSKAAVKVLNMRPLRIECDSAFFSRSCDR